LPRPTSHGRALLKNLFDYSRLSPRATPHPSCEALISVLIILNREPYDSTDVTWNALRLAGKLREGKQDVRIFLMNDAVDLARDVTKKPESYDQDLVQMLKDLIKQGVVVKVCGTCMARCGIHKNQPYFDGAEKSTMGQLASWVVESDRVLTF